MALDLEEAEVAFPPRRGAGGLAVPLWRGERKRCVFEYWMKERGINLSTDVRIRLPGMLGVTC